MIEFISATRAANPDVPKLPLARSLARLHGMVEFTARITASNRIGLPTIYNRRILEGDDDTILVFVHDDIWINDMWIDCALDSGLARFDIVGVAGNQRRLPGAPSWALSSHPPELVFDHPNISGRVGAGQGPFARPVQYGPSMQACKLLDGLFLAARRGTLRGAGVLFDEQFAFHFYDMDFCRTATQAGLTLGTWPINLSHESYGSFEGGWPGARDLYFAKWGD